MYVCTSPGSKKGGSQQGRRKVDNWGGGGQIFIYSFSASFISFESDCFYSLWTWIYEYLPPPNYRLSGVPGSQLNFIQWTQNCLASRNSNKTKQTKTMTKRSQHSFVKTLLNFIRIPSLCNIIKASFKNSSVLMQTRKTVDVVATFPWINPPSHQLSSSLSWFKFSTLINSQSRSMGV
jgi:hypothetical protein